MLESLLLKNRAAILKRWFDLIIETYPADTAEFLKREKDRFLNPVGCSIAQEIGTIYEELIRATDSEKLAQSLDNIVKIRAVQDFSPSQAIAFVFLLKRAIREELEMQENGAVRQLLDFESRIDELALLAFDTYTRRRERIYEIRANEIRGRTAILLERMNLMHPGLAEDIAEPDSIPNDLQRGRLR